MTGMSPVSSNRELLSGTAIVYRLLKPDSARSSGLAAALDFTWSRLQLVKGISDAFCRWVGRHLSLAGDVEL